MDKKGVVGLEKGKAVILGLAFLGILAFAILIAFQSLSDSDVASTSGSGTVNDEVLTTVTEAGELLEYNGLPEAACTVTVARVDNASATVIAADNYTVSNCTVAFTGPDTQFNNTDWAINYTFTYNSFELVNVNVSRGAESFFSNSSTWFALLAIVVLIAIIVIVMRGVMGIGEGKNSGL